MHLYCLTRGIKHEVDKFITQLQGKYMPFEYEKGKTGMLQFSVRPIQLWEFVFPETQLQTVLATLEPKAWESSRINKQLWLLRKALNAKKIPALDPKTLKMPIHKENIEIAGIGIKEDIKINGIEKI